MSILTSSTEEIQQKPALGRGGDQNREETIYSIVSGDWSTIHGLGWRSFASYRTTGSGSVGATFQLGAKLGDGRSGGIPKAILISLTSEERRARPHMGVA
jgi:hypothetical protein